MDLNKILSSLSVKAEWIGLKKVEEIQRFYCVRNGVLDSPGHSIDRGVLASALVDGQFVYAGTQDISVSGIERALKTAIDDFVPCKKHQLYPFSKAQRGLAKGHYKQTTTVPGASIDKDLIRRLFELNQKLRISDKILNAVSFMMMTELRTHYVCSQGSDYVEEIDLFTSNLSATACDGPEVQTRSSGMPCYQRKFESFFDTTLDEQANQIAREAIELLTAEACPNGKYDLILMPDQLYLQLHESIGHPLELDRILGDERNYAGWSFVKQEHFGNLSYGSKLLNVTFAPNVHDEFASYAFDDCGNEAKREYLIKNGVLLRALGSLESQSRTNIPGVANFRSASWNRAPIDRMANINIEPGDISFADMVRQTEKGIIMHTNRSWSIDDYRRKFQFGCEYAQMVENGVVTKTLKKPNYKGITLDFWHALKMVGNSESFEAWGSPWCGKGEPNQVIRVGHAIPVCAFENIDVFSDA